MQKPTAVRSVAPQTVKSGEKARVCTVKSTQLALTLIAKAGAQTANDCIRRDGRKTEMMDVFKNVMTQKVNDVHAVGMLRVQKEEVKFALKQETKAQKKADGLHVQNNVQ